MPAPDAVRSSTRRMDASVAIELGLVARFFERLGDHAVNVVRRLSYLGDVAGSRR